MQKCHLVCQPDRIYLRITGTSIKLTNVLRGQVPPGRLRGPLQCYDPPAGQVVLAQVDLRHFRSTQPNIHCFRGVLWFCLPAGHGADQPRTGTLEGGLWVHAGYGVSADWAVGVCVQGGDA